MDIFTVIIIIIGAIIVGWLYWDKCREVRMLRNEAEPDLPAAAIFFYNLEDRGELLEEAEGMIQPLVEKGFSLMLSQEHDWGYEQRYVFSKDGQCVSWVNYIIDVNHDHPNFAAKVACFDSSLTAAQAIREIAELPEGVSVYAKEEFDYEAE